MPAHAGRRRTSARFDDGFDADDEEKATFYPSDPSLDDGYDTHSASDSLPSARTRLVRSSSSPSGGRRHRKNRAGFGLAHASSPPVRVRIQAAAGRFFPTSPNRRLSRIIGLSLVAAVAGFIVYLIHASYVSARQVELGWAAQGRVRRPKPWQSFVPLEGYYRGIDALVPRSDNRAENAGKVVADTDGKQPKIKHDLPLMDLPTSEDVRQKVGSARPYAPLPEYDSPEYIARHGRSQQCFLDAENKVPVPSVLAYAGVPAGMPDPLVGSYGTVGLDNSVCFDRAGRLGPYGLSEGDKKTIKGHDIDWSTVRWADAQSRCFDANKARFTATTNTTAVSRSVVLVRTWLGYDYTPEDIVHLRALVAEVALQSRGEFAVHFLIHVKDDNLPIWADQDTHDKVLASALPPEFAGMGSLWSERQMGLFYGGLADSMFRSLPVHGVYRSTFMSVQHFSHHHPEFDFVWQWEMDARYVGHFHHLFDTLARWSTAQPRRELWERNGRFYVPAVHGSWDEFTHTVRVQSENGVPDPAARLLAGFGKTSVQTPLPDRPVWGPLRPAEPADHFETADDPVPPTEKSRSDNYEWGVGEAADLITLAPIFDPVGTEWLLADDVSGYSTSSGSSPPPRRAAITTTSRLSRRLLKLMHRETALARHSMFSEMWPSSCALHHGLKAVYAPHPLYFDRAWPADYAVQTLNGGQNGATGGSRDSVFSEHRQHNLDGATWYYRARFGPRLWRRWLGLPALGVGAGADEDAVQALLDEDVDLPQFDDDSAGVPEHLRSFVESARGGGHLWERRPVSDTSGDNPDQDTSKTTKNSKPVSGGTGRMCLPAMLVHPVKRVDGILADIAKPVPSTEPIKQNPGKPVSTVMPVVEMPTR